MKIEDGGILSDGSRRQQTAANDFLFRRPIANFNSDLLPISYPSSDHRLVYTDIEFIAEDMDINRQTISQVDFLGEVVFETGFSFADTEVGGISGLTYDKENKVYYALSDDRSNINDARFYTVGIDLSDGSLDDGDVEFQDVTTLLDAGSKAFAPSTIDPEGIALTDDGNLFISSEGDANNLIDPFVAEFTTDGQIVGELDVSEKFLPTADTSSGIRNNQAFESLTISPDNKYLFTATENALIQDGETSSLEAGSPVRIIQYDLETKEAVGEFLYETDAIPIPPIPEDEFAGNGLVELLAIDNAGTLLALERSIASGVGANIRLYEINLAGATDVSSVDGLLNEEGEITDVDAIVEKKLLADFSDLGITLDNSEAVSFGETLPDGRQSIIVTSDNNFNDIQKTQILALAIDTETIPTVSPVAETPDEIRFASAENPDPNDAPDADDPAIYVHPDDPEKSFVITTFKNGGLRVYDLAGEEIQSITPENIRYNNVDIAYGVEYQTMLVGETAKVDLAIASDRENDTLAIFAINPNGGESLELPGNEILTDVTAFDIPESIFGVDDGEATAYGLATYTSPVDGKTYVFVSQADGNKIAQLEITARLGAADGLEVGAEVVKTIDVPVPDGEDVANSQVEGMVVDRETGYLYVGQEEFGIWKYNAEAIDETPTLVDTVSDNTDLEPAATFNNLVVFGDSLSDTGNLANITNGLLPPSPPYAPGRFSNGDLSLDAITDALGLPESESFLTGGSNYAIVGAQTGEGTVEFDLLGTLPQGIDVPNLGQQVDLYLSSQEPQNTDLFYVYGGANDILFNLGEGQTPPNPVDLVDNIIDRITELATAGAKTFVVPNLPPLGDVPLFSGRVEVQTVVNALTDQFNQLLDVELDAIAQELGVTIIEPDYNAITQEIFDNPAEFGLSNTTDAVLDTDSGTLIGNPDEFFFWDFVHPTTAAAASIIANEAIDLIPDGATQFAGDTPSLVPDVEGLTIYYGEDGNGYLVASSQGNNTFAIYDRAGDNEYLDSFAVEGVAESDGADVINVPLGEDYPAGLLVVQDGSNEPAVVFGDPEDGEIQNFNTNFKYVSLADFEGLLPDLPPYDPNAFDPRNPVNRIEQSTGFDKVFGTIEDDNLDISGAKNFVFAGSGDDAIFLTNSGGNNRVYSGTGNDLIQLGTDVSDVIADFKIGSDILDIAGGFNDLTISGRSSSAVIELNGQDVAILVGVNPSNLTEDSFIFSK